MKAIKSKTKTNILILTIAVLIAIIVLFCFECVKNQSEMINAIKGYTEQTQELTNKLINIIDYVK